MRQHLGEFISETLVMLTMEAFRVSLRTIDDVVPQTFAYTISADNLPAQAVGDAVFKIERTEPSDEARAPQQSDRAPRFRALPPSLPNKSPVQMASPSRCSG